MTANNWVINSSPLILLGKMGRLDWLMEIPQQCHIPKAVADEISAHYNDSATKWLNRVGSSLVASNDVIAPIVAAWDLGRGETAVLSYAWQHKTYSAVLDDRAARQCATALQIPLRGTLGVILLAKQSGLITNISSELNAFTAAGLRLTPELLQHVKQLAGE